MSRIRIFETAVVAFCACVVMVAANAEHALAQVVNTERELMEEVLNQVHNGGWDSALAYITGEVEAAPEAVIPRRVRAGVYERMERYPEGIIDCSVAIQGAPGDSSLYRLRGTLRFKAGDFAGSIADFDKQIALKPEAEQSHWQRGLSYYYAGEFAKGAQQFEQYQEHDGGDVENVVWRMLCQARTEGWDAAQRALLPLERPDSRVPMMQIYELFRGRALVADVMAAAKLGEPEKRVLDLRNFYAHLYVGLYYEGRGSAEEARKHIFAAEKLKNDHYMWGVARVHAERFRQQESDKDQPQAVPPERDPSNDPSTNLVQPNHRQLLAGGLSE